ncbi:hypothetical protein D3C73_813930 [compost metagenome]
MVKTAWRCAGESACGIFKSTALGLVLRFIPVGVVIDLEDMAERILEAESPPVAKVSLVPAQYLITRSLYGLHAPVECFAARGAVADMTDAGCG